MSNGVEHFLKLTLAVYRVTELFPKEGDDLKQAIRISANKVLSDLISNRKFSHQFGELKQLFEQAKAKNWVDPRNFSVLESEYLKIEPVEVPKIITNERQEKILDILKGNGRIKVGNLIQTFPQISRRTLVRDLEELARGGIVVRAGNGRGICYTAKM